MLALAALGALCHCGGHAPLLDAGQEGGPATDGGTATDGGQVDSGTNGGADAGTDAGSEDAGVDAGPVCRTITFSGSEALHAAFTLPVGNSQLALNDAFYSRPSVSGSIGRYDFIDFQFWSKERPTFPFMVRFERKGWLTCTACVLYSTDCLRTGQNCAHDYLAMTGTMTVARADAADAGLYSGSVENLIFEEWDTGLDVSKDAGCLSLTHLTWDAGW